jgi:hypothetical protein
VILCGGNYLEQEIFFVIKILRFPSKEIFYPTYVGALEGSGKV